MQQRLHLDGETDSGGWASLPEATRASVLEMLARLIAKGVVDGEEGGGDE